MQEGGKLSPLMAPLVLLLADVLAATSNMNGRYSVSSVGKTDVPFNDDYASKGHEYFDVWAPEIATTYAQNFWTDQHDDTACSTPPFATSSPV